MPSAIGLRAYLITVHKKGDRSVLAFSARELSVAPDKFLETFISRHRTPTRSDAMERSWYFEEKYDDEGPGNSAGYIHYGTFGYESNLKDSKTKTTQYRRQIDDVEEIPLFYEFWLPEGANYGFVTFQSFAGKSCINLVLAELQEAFSSRNRGYILKVKKLLPTNSSGALYNSAPVKKLRLVKRNASRDLTDKYLGSQGPESVNFEVRISARRSKSLGTFGSIINSIVPNAAGVVLHDGIEFTEAVAEVEIGGRYRRVGVFGSDTEAGVIDVTEEVTKGKDGHPTFESLREQSDAILVDFHKNLSGKRL